jgi:hypothetical protein
MKIAFTLIAGIAIGLAVAHFVLGPVDWPDLGEQAGAAVSDATVTASVRAALALQKEFDLFGDIRVAASSGVVTLEGRVDNENQRKLAELITRGVEGVEDVVNRIVVGPAGATTGEERQSGA